MGRPLRALRWLGVLACAPLLAGCYTLSYNVDEVYGLPATRPQVIRSFKVEVKHHHLVYGLVTVGNPDEVEGAIAREVKLAGGRAATNVRVTHQVNIIDGIIRLIPYNIIYLPTTSIVEGDVVR
ncbi:MAG: hypothetical protein VKS61_10380 [Candidatus Sericytochromatia bacterium]|nr:hypothetical protein [Candidatus Sericytochromatia bacterium]